MLITNLNLSLTELGLTDPSLTDLSVTDPSLIDLSLTKSFEQHGFK